MKRNRTNSVVAVAVIAAVIVASLVCSWNSCTLYTIIPWQVIPCHKRQYDPQVKDDDGKGSIDWRSRHGVNYVGSVQNPTSPLERQRPRGK